MSHLQLIQGGAQEPQIRTPAPGAGDLATYRVQAVRTRSMVEVVLHGPALPEGLVIATLHAEDTDKIQSALAAAEELAEERNFDLIYGATQALARVNRAIDLLVVSADKPVFLDYDRGPRDGGGASKLCVDYEDTRPCRSSASDYVKAIFAAARKRAGAPDA